MKERKKRKKRVPPQLQCPSGERCYRTIGTWMTLPAFYGSKPGERFFWEGNKQRCSGDCMAEQWDKFFNER